MLSEIDDKIVWGVLSTLILSVADATFTLIHIRFAGGTEWNPAMEYVLGHYGVQAFVITKMILTGLGMVILGWFYQRARWPQYVFWGVVCAYILLTFYHLYCAMTYWEVSQ